MAFGPFKLLALPALLLSLLVTAPARADVIIVTTPDGGYEPARWGLGLRLGEPTGFTVKRYLGGRNAWDFNLDAVYGPGLRVGVDYLWGLAQLLVDRSSLDLNVYVGLGPFVGVLQGPCGGLDNWHRGCDGDVYFGGRVPIGIEALFRNVPFTLGLEVAPGIAVAPGRAGFLVDASLIVRILLR